MKAGILRLKQNTYVFFSGIAEKNWKTFVQVFQIILCQGISFKVLCFFQGAAVKRKKHFPQ
jgi:hypothetical protein